MQPSKRDISELEQYRYYCYVVNSLLPWLKEFQLEQNAEKAIEATIRGINLYFHVSIRLLAENALILNYPFLFSL